MVVPLFCLPLQYNCIRYYIGIPLQYDFFFYFLLFINIFFMNFFLHISVLFTSSDQSDQFNASSVNFLSFF